MPLRQLTWGLPSGQAIAQAAETLIGLVRADPTSYLNLDPAFRPFLGADLVLGASSNANIGGSRSYTRAHFLYYAGVVNPGIYREGEAQLNLLGQVPVQHETSPPNGERYLERAAPTRHLNSDVLSPTQRNRLEQRHALVPCLGEGCRDRGLFRRGQASGAWRRSSTQGG